MIPSNTPFHAPRRVAYILHPLAISGKTITAEMPVLVAPSAKDAGRNTAAPWGTTGKPNGRSTATSTITPVRGVRNGRMKPPTTTFGRMWTTTPARACVNAARRSRKRTTTVGPHPADASPIAKSATMITAAFPNMI